MPLTRRCLTLLALSLQLSAFSLAAQNATQDLGQGLAYVRVHDLGATLPAVVAALHEPQALVLDVRYATADSESARSLTAAFAGRPANALLLVLVGPATPRTVAQTLTTLPRGALTLGPDGLAPAPNVIVQTSPDDDRRAYAAADAGAPLAALLSGKIQKERYDEAALMKDFANGNPNPEPPPPPDPTAKKAAAPAAEPPPLTDRILQRAVHLHRALLALNRLPKAA